MELSRIIMAKTEIKRINIIIRGAVDKFQRCLAHGSLDDDEEEFLEQIKVAEEDLLEALNEDDANGDDTEEEYMSNEEFEWTLTTASSHSNNYFRPSNVSVLWLCVCNLRWF